ncbi:MAG: protein kinase domain-containing protein [Bryobacteraceae bacterium]
MPLEPGTKLGGYEILASVGEGGMGEVYRARDPRLQRDVAIKVLPKHLSSDPEALARFQGEASAVAALSHPNILTIFDSGVDRGVFFFVMEFLEGESLRTRLNASALPWRKAAEIAGALAEGISAAHSKGIIHRDLKPENVFLTPAAVKILDFGLARWKPARPELDDDRTIELDADLGKILGTIGYMSPEQVRGLTAEATSDVFSLGCILHEMVTGRQPFKRATPVQTMTAILEQDPPEVSSSGKLAPSELSRIIAHCLEKDPGDRFQSARDLAFALRSVVDETITWKPAPARKAKAIPSLAVMPFQNAGGDPAADYLCDGITESIINSVSALPKLRVVPRTLIFRYKAREIDPAAVGGELHAAYLVTGRVLQRGDVVNVQTELVDVNSESQVWGEKYNFRFSDVFAVQEEIANQISAKLRLHLTPAEKKRLSVRHTENTEAYELYLKGRHHWNQRTSGRLQKALEFYRAALEKDPEYALAHAGVAECYALFFTFSVGPPHETCPKSKEAALKALALDPKLAEAHVSLGYVKALYDYDWAGAETEFLKGIALKPVYPTAHHWYGLALNAMGRFDQAIEETNRALAIDPPSSSLGTALAYSYFYARRYEEGIDQARNVLELHPAYGIAFYFMGLCFEQKGMAGEAVDCLRKAVDLLDGNPTATAGLGHALGIAGRREEALQVLQTQLQVSRKRYVAPHDIAVIHAGLGDRDSFFEWLDKAREDHSPWLPFIKSDPRSDPYREDPRFKEVLTRIGLADELNAPNHMRA